MKKIVAAIVTAAVAASVCLTVSHAQTLGDADGDSKISAADARLVLRAAVGLEDKKGKESVLDVDGDGSVTASDARLVLRFAVGLEDAFPAQSALPNAGSTTTGGKPADPDVPQTAPYSRQTTIPVKDTTAPPVKDTTAPPAEESTTAPDESPRIMSDLDVIHSGTFYFEGVMTDVSGAKCGVKVGAKGGKIYMVMEPEDFIMGLIHNGRTNYLFIPGSKVYTALDKQLLDMVGLDESDLMFDVGQFVADTDKMDLISSERTELDGKEVTMKVYRGSDGIEIRHYLDGNRLLRIENYGSDGRLYGATDFDFIKAEVDDSLFEIPSDYRRQSILGFMSNFGDMLKADLPF